ncbi:MAG: hypothetical protein Q8R86_05455 [Sulfuricurvum sp.]|nr:hypothetical protein [Sulfuricurvum sp.]
MSYLLWFGIVAFIFALLHYFTELNGRQKGTISAIVTLIVTGAIAYNLKSDAQSKHIASIELKFTNGETLVCSTVKVNNKDFTYSVGTQSFVGNKGTSYYQQIFSASECE